MEMELTTQISPFDVAREFDLARAREEVGDTEGMALTSLLLRYIQRVYSMPFELARDVLNVLIRLGKLARSSFTTVRFL